MLVFLGMYRHLERLGGGLVKLKKTSLSKVNQCEEVSRGAGGVCGGGLSGIGGHAGSMGGDLGRCGIVGSKKFGESEDKWGL